MRPGRPGGWIGPLAVVLWLTAATPPLASPRGAPIWREEFDGPGVAPNPAAWAFDIGTGAPGLPGWGNGEAQYYTDTPRNAFVQGGLLHIRAVLDDPDRPGHPGPTSARLISRSGLWAAYGTYEIRALLPCGRGAWPALWMLGESGDWPARGEIDLAEWSGRYFGPDQIQAALHAAAFSGAAARVGETRLTAACGAFHVWRLDWSPDAVRVGVDGRPAHLTYQRPPGADQDRWPFDQPFRLILNVAVGGTLGGEVEPPPSGMFEMLVDYVRIYAAPAAPPPRRPDRMIHGFTSSTQPR